jgi:hypothetical protein
MFQPIQTRAEGRRASQRLAPLQQQQHQRSLMCTLLAKWEAWMCIDTLLLHRRSWWQQHHHWHWSGRLVSRPLAFQVVKPRLVDQVCLNSSCFDFCLSFKILICCWDGVVSACSRRRQCCHCVHIHTGDAERRSLDFSLQWAWPLVLCLLIHSFQSSVIVWWNYSRAVLSMEI